jgi:hypothetical protein
MKTMLLASLALVAAMLPAHAGTRTMFDCDEASVEETFRRVTGQGDVTISNILKIENVRSPDPTEVRLCRAEVLTNRGAMAEVIYELRWTSSAEGRYMLSIKGARWL